MKGTPVPTQSRSRLRQIVDAGHTRGLQLMTLSLAGSGLALILRALGAVGVLPEIFVSPVLPSLARALVLALVFYVAGTALTGVLATRRPGGAPR